MSEPARRQESIPAIEDDPFSIPFLHDPYPHYERMREAGPVVWLSRYRCYAVARHDEVQKVLGDWETFISAAGVGLANFHDEKPWRPPSIVLEADPPLHTRTRTVLTRVLSPGNVRRLRERFEREAEDLVDRVVAMGRFDGIGDFAEAYPVKVFPDAIGLPEEGRENLLRYGSMVFNSFGPRNALTEAAFVDAEAVRSWIMENCARDRLEPDGLGAQIYAAVESGDLSEQEAPMLLRSFLSAGIDTTVDALGNTLWCLATFTDQWERLRQTPSLARNAFEEALRYEGSAQVFFRTTARDTTIGGLPVVRNRKVAAFMGSANRDPRRWPSPDVFDIERRAAGHLTLGTGIHGCVGQAVARLEGEAVFAALARKVKSVELTAEPTRHYNNVLRSFERLPVQVTPAAS
ncbi:MAG TPA: cytochrome P450 [Xanthobacteraceae bacterium]|nr:cytochrome P450 [Xanthobacteraceae bacterium]